MPDDFLSTIYEEEEEQGDSGWEEEREKRREEEAHTSTQQASPPSQLRLLKDSSTQTEPAEIPDITDLIGRTRKFTTTRAGRTLHAPLSLPTTTHVETSFASRPFLDHTDRKDEVEIRSTAGSSVTVGSSLTNYSSAYSSTNTSNYGRYARRMALSDESSSDSDSEGSVY